MSKNDIRLRRQRFARGADRYRNYGAVMERHEKEKKLKIVIRAFSMFLVALIVIMLIVILGRLEKKSRTTHKPTVSGQVITVRGQIV
ncbi:MAG: hypothetical protein K1X47_06645 [Cyclobacteriaceae bacterium]|nr:hypothetical protein [Cyclobacteriaceae bacterium]